MGNAWDGHGGMTTFNVHDGLEEAMIRGYRSGFLTDVEYDQLLDYKPPQENENPLNDIRLNLQETDYGTFLGDYEKELNKEALKRRMQEKLADEFEYIRCLASPELAKFLDFVACKYMIANVITVLREGLKNNVNMTNFLEEGDNFNPLGRFDDTVFRSLLNVENSAEGIAELYRTVLLDTPIGPYFGKVVEALGGGDLKALLGETSWDLVEMLLYRFYLEDFYAYCQSLGGETAECMGEILEQIADHRSISITYNSVSPGAMKGSKLLAQPNHHVDRAMLFPTFGTLYPYLLEKHQAGRRVGFFPISQLNELRFSLSQFPQFKNLSLEPIMEGRDAPVNGNLNDLFKEQEIRLCELAFEGQFHYGMFYAYFRLKEQEIDNVEYIAYLTMLGDIYDQTKKSIHKVFSKASPWRRANQTYKTYCSQQY